jgi:hypothetical protein
MMTEMDQPVQRWEDTPYDRRGDRVSALLGAAVMNRYMIAWTGSGLESTIVEVEEGQLDRLHHGIECSPASDSDWGIYVGTVIMVTSTVLRWAPVYLMHRLPHMSVASHDAGNR